MDPGTVLAIVSLIVGSVDKVIASFDRLQNAPKELRDFRTSAARLRRHFQRLQADVGNTSTLLHQDDVQEIEDTLTLCQELFQQHEDRQSQGIVNVVLRTTWSIRNNQKLARYKARIDDHYSKILVPVWIQSKSARSHVEIHPLPPEDRNVQPLEYGSTIVTTLVPVEELQSISQLIEKLKTADNKEVTEQMLRNLDQRLERCWAELGLPVGEVFDNAGLTDQRRQSSLKYEVAPTTLYLNNALEKHRGLRLERVHIMARDDESRILQYQNSDTSIHVTHIVPYGSIPWTSEKYSKRVSFLKPHVITVVDNEGYHLYHIDPKYKFKDLEICEKFQSMLRERELCGAFEAVEIAEADNIVSIVSRRQVIRFWQRKFPNKRPLVTMTFLQSSILDGRQHKEIDIAKFKADPEFHIPRTFPGIRRHTESNILDIFPLVLDTRTLHIKFDLVQDAQNFKKTFWELHPTTQPDHLSPLAARTAHSISQPGTQIQSSPPTSRFGLVSKPTISPEPQVPLSYTAAQSATPSLYSASVSSATPRSTLAPTPSDNNWNTVSAPIIVTTSSLDEDPDEWSPVYAAIQKKYDYG